MEEQRAAYNTNRTGILTNCGGDILGKFSILPLTLHTNTTKASLGFQTALSATRPASNSMLSLQTGQITSTSSLMATLATPMIQVALLPTVEVMSRLHAL